MFSWQAIHAQPRGPLFGRLQVGLNLADAYSKDRITPFADADETTATRKNTLSVFYQVGSNFVQSGQIHIDAKQAADSCLRDWRGCVIC